jgi:hypothetical protein
MVTVRMEKDTLCDVRNSKSEGSVWETCILEVAVHLSNRVSTFTLTENKGTRLVQQLV